MCFLGSDYKEKMELIVLIFELENYSTGNEIMKVQLVKVLVAVLIVDTFKCHN